MPEIKLTQYSHGAGCGCKISPEVLGSILHTNEARPDHKNLLVGNDTRDDAAVLDLGNGTALISTTDFFMPIVDDPFDFGRIASANAISDVYAMGGVPVLAIAILGWPIDKLGPEVARKVIEGARAVCAEAGIPLAGGHSIDSPEPIFGLAVNGTVFIADIKTNSGAQPGNILFITKPLGIGIYTTGEKKGLLKPEHKTIAVDSMTRLNKIGAILGTMPEVNALTDITGFGLLGHLKEMCEGSGVTAEINFESIPVLPDLEYYIENKCLPGGTVRNWKSYGESVGEITEYQKAILADPQTSGGLLISVAEGAVERLINVLKANELGEFAKPVGRICEAKEGNLIRVYS
jgi:selenide,water dikinase